jgi:hypothetical protein
MSCGVQCPVCVQSSMFSHLGRVSGVGGPGPSTARRATRTNHQPRRSPREGVSGSAPRGEARKSTRTATPIRTRGSLTGLQMSSGVTIDKTPRYTRRTIFTSSLDRTRPARARDVTETRDQSSHATGHTHMALRSLLGPHINRPVADHPANARENPMALARVRRVGGRRSLTLCLGWHA